MTVSVIIPCYNAATVVGEAVTSVWKQTWQPLEIICVDDGSTDETREVLEDLAMRSTVPFELIGSENRGAAHARALATARASGTYLQYLDADDLLLPGKLAHQMEMIAKADHPPDLVVAAYQEVHGDRSCEVAVESEPWMALMRTRLGITSSNLWRRETVDMAGGWDSGWKTTEDTELVFRILKNGARVLRDDEPLTVKQLVPGSLWHADPPSSRATWWRLRVLMAEYLLGDNGPAGVNPEAICRFLFPRLRSLYATDRNMALEVHERLARAGVKPWRGSITGPYLAAYRIFGFSGAEWLATQYRKVARR